MNAHTPFNNLTQLIAKSSKILVFTGAGISTDSGISDYRSKGGVWKRFRPVTIQEFVSSEEKRKEYWITKRELYDSLKTAKPNSAHHAVKKLQDTGKLLAVITQNIDGLHATSGIAEEKLIEMHGTNLETVCLECEEITGWEETLTRLNAGEDAPLCKQCGGFLKPNTISFGQNLKPDVLDHAFRLTAECDCVLVLGSTLVVEPAASIPRQAKSQGARLAIVTLSETPLDQIADIKIQHNVSEVMAECVKDL